MHAADPLPSSETPPRVSVVIPSFNRARFLNEAIDSVLAQTCRDFEVIVVDDASTDDTPALLAAYGERVRVLGHPRNRGVSAARNTGIAAARGAFIALLDSDDVWNREKLAFQLARLESEPGVEAIWNTMRVVPSSSSPAEPPPARDEMSAVERPGRPMSTLLVRREAIERIGRFDETFHYAEDIDFMYRVRQRTRYLFDERPVGAYRWHEGNTSGRWNRDHARSLVRLYERWAHVGPEIVKQARLKRALAHYRLAVLELDEGGRAREAARLFVRAALLDPLVEVRRQRDQRLTRRAFGFVKPWVAATACALGLGVTWRALMRSPASPLNSAGAGR